MAGVESLPTDFADESSVTSTCDQLIERLASHEGSSICLVHNAALMLKDRCDTTEDDDLRQVLAVNVVGINTLNRALLPKMPAQSSVLYVGSTLSEKAVAGAFSYIVSKHAQLGMMRATCQDLMGGESTLRSSVPDSPTPPCCASTLATTRAFSITSAP